MMSKCFRIWSWRRSMRPLSKVQAELAEQMGKITGGISIPRPVLTVDR